MRQTPHTLAALLALCLALPASAGAPSLSIQCSDPEPTVGQEVWFVGRADNDGAEILHWLWRFGDGSSTHGQKVRHVYQFPGVYYVRLVAVTTEGDRAVAYRTVFVSTGDGGR